MGCINCREKVSFKLSEVLCASKEIGQSNSSLSKVSRSLMEESRMQLGLSVCFVTALSTLMCGNHGAFPSANAERNGLQSARDVSNTNSDIL